MKHTLSLFDEGLQSLQEEVSEMDGVAKERQERVVEAMDPWDPKWVGEFIGADDLVKLAKNVKQKLVLAMRFFSETDASIFKKLSKEDRKTYTISKRVLYKFIGKKEKINMQHILNIVLFTRSLERIGDHAKNIAEHVIYMSERRDIRSAENRASVDP